MTKSKKLPFSWPHIVLTVILLGIIGVIIWLFSSSHPQNDVYENTSLAMGTYVQQTVYGSNAAQAAEDAAQAVSELEDLISWRKEDSDVAKINANAGNDWVSVDSKTASLLARCLDVAQQSGGAFDPAILPLSSLWDFGGENQHLPSAEDIQRFLPYVDYTNLRVNSEENSASLKNSMYALDLGGAGKGAACDEVVASYEESGVSCGIVAVGGSVGIFGQKPDHSDWTIAIRNPFQNLSTESNVSMGTLSLSGGFVSTSGIYEKYFEEDGKLYHHILDPDTGYPVENNLVSVTVVCDNGALSDMLSTACFVLGAEKSQELLAHYDAQAIFIDQDKRVFITEGLRSRVSITAEGYTLLDSLS